MLKFTKKSLNIEMKKIYVKCMKKKTFFSKHFMAKPAQRHSPFFNIGPSRARTV